MGKVMLNSIGDMALYYAASDADEKGNNNGCLESNELSVFLEKVLKHGYGSTEGVLNIVRQACADDNDAKTNNSELIDKIEKEIKEIRTDVDDLRFQNFMLEDKKSANYASKGSKIGTIVGGLVGIFSGLLLGGRGHIKPGNWVSGACGIALGFSGAAIGTFYGLKVGQKIPDKETRDKAEQYREENVKPLENKIETKKAELDMLLRSINAEE